MYKNLILFHVEAMSRQAFWYYQKCLPTLRKLKERALYFSNCHSAGTSTTFTMASLLWGSGEEFDSSTTRYPRETIPGITPESFVGMLRRKHGYEAHFIFITKLGGQGMPYAPADFDTCTEVVAGEGWECELERLLAARNRGKPQFFLFHNMCDMMHFHVHPSLLRTAIASDIGGMTDFILEQEEQIFAGIVEALQKHDLFDESVVVAYGDHGSDMVRKGDSSAGKHGTYVSSLSAYVPMFIANSLLGSGTNDCLASLDDLPPTIYRLLFPEEEETYRPTALFGGIDLTREKREYVFTQNKYALQDPNTRDAELPKGYAVSDGTYRLVIYDADIKEHSGGMELYLECMDPGNQFDLLRLFAFDKKGDIAGFRTDLIRKELVWYLPFWNVMGVPALAKRFSGLRNALHKYVRGREAKALGRLPSGMTGHTMSEASFILPASGWTDGDRKPAAIPDAKFASLAESQRQVLLFGVQPTLTTVAAATFLAHGVEVVGVMDNNQSFQGRIFGGITVYAPQAAAVKFPGALAVGCVARNISNAEIERQSRELGLEYCSYCRDIIDLELSERYRSSQ